MVSGLLLATTFREWAASLYRHIRVEGDLIRFLVNDRRLLAEDTRAVKFLLTQLDLLLNCHRLIEKLSYIALVFLRGSSLNSILCLRLITLAGTRRHRCILDNERLSFIRMI